MNYFHIFDSVGKPRIRHIQAMATFSKVIANQDIQLQTAIK